MRLNNFTCVLTNGQHVAVAAGTRGEAPTVLELQTGISRHDVASVRQIVTEEEEAERFFRRVLGRRIAA